MTKRNFCESVTLVCPLGSAVLVKSRFARYFASNFLTMARLSLSGIGTERSRCGLSSCQYGGSNGAPRLLEGFAEALARHLSLRALSGFDPSRKDPFPSDQ